MSAESILEKDRELLVALFDIQGTLRAELLAGKYDTKPNIAKSMSAIADYRTASQARLLKALEPFARLAVADDVLAGMTPDEFREHVADARAAISKALGQHLGGEGL